MPLKTLLPLLLISSTIHAAIPQYRITPIRNLTEEPRGDYNFKLIDFNDKGEMLMQHTVYMSRGTSPYSIVTHNNGEITQSFFGGRYIEVSALSNSGQWIGRGMGKSWISKSHQDNNSFPTMSIFNAIGDSDTVVTIITEDTEINFIPLKINNTGQILGIAHPGDSPHLATKTAEGWVLADINTSLILDGDTSISPNIQFNDSGQIAGTSIKNNENHAFVAFKSNDQWNTTALGSLGGNFSTVSGLNNSGQIVGISNLTDSSSHGFLATKTSNNWSMIDLGTLGGKNSTATDINDAGDIVGSSEVIGQNHSSALLISGSQAFKLIDLVSEQFEGWTELTSAFKINNNGQIVGTGKYNNQFWNYLLDPINPRQSLPPVCEMGIDPQTIKAGEGTALWWWSDAVKSAKINHNIGNIYVPTDYTWIYPTETSTFTMTAKGNDGTSTTCKTTLTVEAGTPPPICEMGTDPEIIRLGQGFALWWWTENVSSAKIDQNIESVATPSNYLWFPGASAENSSFIQTTTTYTMTATGVNGKKTSCQATIELTNRH